MSHNNFYSGVEVSLDTQNDLLDLTAQRLGNIPAKQVFGFEEVSNSGEYGISLMFTAFFQVHYC